MARPKSWLRRTVMLALQSLPVLSYSEVTGAGLQIETVGVIQDVLTHLK